MSMSEAFRRAGVDVPDQPERRDEMARPQDRRRSRPGGGRRDDGRNRERHDVPSPQFPDAYFESDPAGNRYLLPAFVSRANVDALASRMGSAHPALTTGQLRRFYNYCRTMERQLNVEGRSWQQVAADFEALAFHAQYAHSARKIPQEFQQFIDDNVRRVNAASGYQREAFLRGFLPHFEALVGFASAHLRLS